MPVKIQRLGFHIVRARELDLCAGYVEGQIAECGLAIAHDKPAAQVGDNVLDLFILRLSLAAAAQGIEFVLVRDR